LKPVCNQLGAAAIVRQRLISVWLTRTRVLLNRDLTRALPGVFAPIVLGASGCSSVAQTLQHEEPQLRIRIRVATLASGIIGLAALLSSPIAARAEGSQSCNDGSWLQAACHDHQTGMPEPRRDPASVARAKTEAANVYSRYREGDATLADVLRADQVVGRLTSALSPQRSILAALSTADGNRAVLEGYMPFRQINSYYCGPATVQSMLWQLTGSERPVQARRSDEALALTGDPNVDQPRLASERWLSTETFGGTPWGDEFIPRTLNTWLASNWYVSAGTANVDGNLDKDQAMRNIQYSIDRGYPVAANVVYSPETYYPAGFYPGVTYSHWDTIYGYDEQDGRSTVRVGQVYASDGMDYQPRQQVDWDTHWNAIGSWYGIVW